MYTYFIGTGSRKRPVLLLKYMLGILKPHCVTRKKKLILITNMYL